MEAPAARPPPPWRSKEPHFQVPALPSKSNSNTLCKALIVVILLLVIPLFPSQAPDFISQSLVTEFWEILHLLFIGIAVSYGLLCRKSDQLINPEPIVHSRSDDTHAYLSGISNLSSFFEDRYENMSGPDELDDGSCGCLLRSSGQFLSVNECVIHGGSKFRDYATNGVNLDDFGGNVNGVNEDEFGGNGKNFNETFRSQYLKSESLVVVSNGKCFAGEISDFKPLNLPVRSLRSTIKDIDKTDANCSPMIEDKSSEDGNGKVLKIRGVVPMNLEKKFDEVAGPSPIPWRSNSGRVGTGEDRNYPKAGAHCRPHSVGEVEFEHINKSRSFLVPWFSSSPELVASSVVNVESSKAFPVSQSKVEPLNGEALFGGENSRLPGSDNHGKEDKAGKGKQAIESLISEIKSSASRKVLSKAKSVRTIKPRRYTMDEKEQWSRQMDKRLGRMRKKFEADSLVITGSGDEPENPLASHEMHQFDHAFPTLNAKPMPTVFHNEEKEFSIDDHTVTESEEETRSGLDKSSSEEVPRTNCDVDSELEGSEVDRKAGEFIAKFREQIRLQKVSSVEG